MAGLRALWKRPVNLCQASAGRSARDRRPPATCHSTRIPASRRDRRRASPVRGSRSARARPGSCNSRRRRWSRSRQKRQDRTVAVPARSVPAHGPRLRATRAAAVRPRVKADQKAGGRYLGGKVPLGFRLGESGDLVPHEAEQEAICEMVELRAQGRSLRAIADAVRANGHRISHEGVAGVLKTAGI